MLAYFILILAPLLFSALIGIRHKYDSMKKGVVSLFFSVMLFLLILRDESIGVDLYTYKIIFNNIEKQDLEVGYELLNKFVILLGGDFRWLLIFVSLISVVPVWILYYKESGEVWVSIGLFLYFLFSMYFSGLRQVLAISFVVPAFYCTKNRKPVRFLLCVLLACLFHKSALILVLLYPVYNIRFSKGWLIFIIPAIVLMFVFNKQIFSFLLNNFGAGYIEKYGVELTSTGAYGALALLIILAVFCYVLPRESDVDRETYGLRNVLFLAIVLQCFAPIHPLAMRLNYYFLLLVPVLISRIVIIGKERYAVVSILSRLIIPTVFVVYFIVNGYLGQDILSVFPYIPMWA